MATFGSANPLSPALAAASGLLATGNVFVIHAGTWTPHATLGAAKTAAVSGDTILVCQGTYNENNLLKDGVNWYFMAGATVAYTGGGTADCGIFDNSANGTNGSVTCTIGGYGTFSNLAGEAAFGGVLAVGKHATINLEAKALISDRGCVRLIDTVWTSVVHVRADTITSSSGLYGTVMYTQGSRLYVEANLIEGTGGTPAIDQSSDDPAAVIVIHAKRIVATGAYATILSDDSETLYIEAEEIVGIGCPAIYVQKDAAGSTTIKASVIRSEGGFANAAVKIGNDSIVTIDCPLITTSGNSQTALTFDAAGTLRLFNARVVATTGSGNAMSIAGGGTVQLFGACAFVSPSAATDSVTASTAQNLTVFGFACGNKALNANITPLVAPAANLVWSNASVV